VLCEVMGLLWENLISGQSPIATAMITGLHIIVFRSIILFQHSSQVLSHTSAAYFTENIILEEKC
jgi:hypothetical protein